MEKNFAQKLARQAILNLTPYSSAREEFSGQEAIFLDANESPYNKPWNRYPDPYQTKLRQRIAALKGLTPQQVILGNGSDELLDMLMRTFCEPGKDRVLSVTPSYGMYRVCAGINALEYDTVALQPDFSLPVDQILAQTHRHTRLLFLCSPNNPTGNAFAADQLKKLLKNFHGLVVVDEAYADFSRQKSWTTELSRYPNLVVLQTLSKAWGLAAIRLGMAFAHEQVIELLNKVKPPYNVNTLSQEKAYQALSDPGKTQDRIQKIIEERDALMQQLSEIPLIKKVYPSEANFFLVKVDDPAGVYDFLLQKGIIVRNRSHEPLCEGCLRISTGTPQQNQYLVEVLQNTGNPGSDSSWKAIADRLSLPDRESKVSRTTRETHIRITLNLDGTGQAAIDTGMGFFDHMLEQIARHSGCDLQIDTQGDLQVDEHHTMEDTALVLGEAFQQALGPKTGIERYGFALPMDDCAALVLLDFGGRPELVWKARFKREKIGNLPTEMLPHFFKSFALGARCNIYIKAKGKNEHHKAEAIFKALARAIRMAVKREAGSEILPSTKGVL